jgi:DNA-binding MarR family transcriptional regulator
MVPKTLHIPPRSLLLPSLAKGRTERTAETGETLAGISDQHSRGQADVRLGPLERYIAFHLRLAQNASFKAFKRESGDPELRPGWFAVLSLIESNSGITPMLLSRASGRDKSTLTPILRDLSHRHLIERLAVPNDKRSYALALTPEGRDKLRELSAHAEIHDRKLDQIAGAKKGELIALLRRISTMLD